MADRTHTVAVVCPHPDDETIFCGGTIRLLVDAGHRVIVVAATTGDAGVAPVGGSASELAAVRAAELSEAAEILGVEAVHHLGFPDTGMDPSPRHGSFATVPVEHAGERLASILRAERVTAVVCDDAEGIYGHPDHRRAHAVAVRAAELAQIGCVHEVTVDREHLHFVETHLVATASDALAESAPGSPPVFGRSTVEIDVLVDLGPALAAKRAAFAAHASQLPPGSPVMVLGDDAFRAVYGIEWFCRRGEPGPIEELVAAGR
jgi:LmbE family N-acetylglucosaminyl deacetylase